MRGHEGLRTASFGIMLCVAMGCGKSRDIVSNSHGGNRDGGESGDQGRAAGSTTSQPLPDDTAGTACKTNEDCANGVCLTSIPGSLGGTSMSAPGGYCSAACMADSDCGEGGVCSGAFPAFGGSAAMPGRCMKGCNSAADCRDGYRCVNGLGMAATASQTPDPTAGLLGPNACQPVPATTQLTDGVTGKTCEEDKDCGQGHCLKTEGMMTYPGGYCSGSCLRDADCGVGGTCTLPAIGDGAGSCYLTCQTHGDSDCREGYRCRTNGSRRQCLPGAAPLGTGVVGRECQSDADCGGAAMSCATKLGDATAPGGYCSISCSESSDCGVDGTCVGGLGATFTSLLGETGVCYRACVDSSSCRAGFVCAQPSSAAAGALGGLMMGSSTACVVAPVSDEDAGMR